MRNTIRLAAFFISVLFFTAIARAQSQGAYLGAGIGSSHASFNPGDFSLELPQVAESADRASVAGKVFAGYRFGRNFSAEVGYFNLGKFAYDYDGGASGAAAIDYKVTGIAASGLATFPAAVDFYLLGRIGAFGSTTKASLASTSGSIGNTLAGAGITAGSGASVHKTTLYFGLGAQYDYSGGVCGRFEYENFGEVGNGSDTGRAKVSLISVSMLVRF